MQMSQMHYLPLAPGFADVPADVEKGERRCSP
jgi:hypothetical protein